MSMAHIYLQRHDAAHNVHRFYALWVLPGIFGEWALVREWGRVGSPGTVRKTWFATEAEALQAEEKFYLAKRKKGYQ